MTIGCCIQMRLTDVYSSGVRSRNYHYLSVDRTEIQDINWSCDKGRITLYLTARGHETKARFLRQVQMQYRTELMRFRSAVCCRSCRESRRYCWVLVTARFQWGQPCCRTYDRLLPARIQQKHACLQRGYVLREVPLPSANY